MAKEVVEVPMAGKILSVEVKVGDRSKRMMTLRSWKSMKMENPIVARSGQGR